MKFISVVALISVLISAAWTQGYQIGDHELLFMPTAYTMPSGKSYFTDYELVFLNFTHGLTGSTHLGVFTLFPITKDFLKTLTLGIKQRYLHGSFVKGALWASYTPEISGLTVGNVFSFGKGPAGFHAGISWITEFEGETKDSEFIFLGGYRLDVSNKVSFLFEYTNFSTLIEEDFNGLLSIGIRFRGSDISWDLAGIRPLESSGDLLFIPYLKASIYID